MELLKNIKLGNICLGSIGHASRYGQKETLIWVARVTYCCAKKQQK